ncbi:MAG: hypothetical protein ACREK8_02665 [Gemmatimonadales bacterium]
MARHVKLFAHPVHQMLIVFPLGLLGAGAIFDIIQPSSLAFVLELVGLALAWLTGWLGGELVDRLGVGVDDGANVAAPSSLRGPVIRAG